MNLSHSIGDDESDVKRNRARFFGSMNIQLEQLAIPRQVHGDIVRYVHEPGTYESCDGLTTDCPRVFLVVSVADCLPIVLVDPRKRAIAAVHAGWRGSESMVVLKAMRLMKDQYGTRADELLAYIGPAAGVCCYEVGPEVESRFDERYLHRTAQLKAHLDLKAFNKDLLVSSGVGKLHIEVSNLCTICNPKLLHSYRRDRINSGRMMCVVGLTD
ncbi:MAG: peptidoglycan editing factor PgeF [Ignavibacteria bacterium]|nr:peptidoglycan editing factor PgeF [Ignavibacteria bacterium]MBI3766395.1 peptidoglycan editing factor PgeF [Ignavibacteriales bacterium]